MKKKLGLIRKVFENESYLRDEYNANRLYANRNGDVEFDSLIEWLHTHQQEVSMIIEMANNIERLQ
tara:strand:- start:1179 stop:1376 length:198 start_codon:yes stop_codon:yes gene_type:complete